MMTSATSDAGTLLRVKTSRMTMAPSSCALSELSEPFKFPIGVLPAATITTSVLLYPELAAIVKLSLETKLKLYVPSYMKDHLKIEIPLFWYKVLVGSSFHWRTRNMASQVDHVSPIFGIQISHFPFHLTFFGPLKFSPKNLHWIKGNWFFLFSVRTRNQMRWTARAVGILL